MSSPWAKIDKPEPLNLQDIMSEQVAADLAKKELNVLKNIPVSKTNDHEYQKNPRNEYAASSDNYMVEPVDSDAEIARMLQAQFDREYDEELKRNQDKFNGASKVSISYKHYFRSNTQDDDSYSEEEDVTEKKDRFYALEKELGSMPMCGYKIKDGNIITKHDTTLSGRKNACKMLSFPPGFETGDGENIDLKLPNKVYNSLKIYSQSEQARRHKIRDRKDRSTAVFGFDDHTTLLLYNMLNFRLLDACNGVISIGKEAVILHADGCVGCDIVEVPKECVIKIFKTTLSEFKHREIYIRSDRRFKDRIGKQRSRKTINIWAEKEMANLCRMKKAEIPCPDVVMLKNHLLVLSFLGENRVPAKKLKDAFMDAADYIVAYDQVADMMKTLYRKAKLIHADLSEYNILWHKGQCYFIDVSQSVEPVHENAFHFLLRDCRNITNFFVRKSVPNILNAEQLFEAITGFKFDNQEELLKFQHKEKPKPHNIDDLHLEAVGKFEKAWITFNSYENMDGRKTGLVEPSKA